MNNQSVAIIGFGTAGFNAAAALRTHGYKGDITIFSNTTTLPYSPILTSYYAGGKKEYDECFPWSKEEIDDLHAHVIYGHAVSKLDVKNRIVQTEEGAFPYSKCIIASGSTSTSIGFPKDCGYTPFMLRTMDDAEALKHAITDPGCKRMLVSGASMVSLKILEACLNRGLNMTLVGIMPHVLDMNALPQAAARFEKGLRNQNVELRLAQSIKEVRVVADDSHPLGRKLEVTFSNGDIDEFDQIAVAHGMRNNLEFIEEGALEIDRGILVDDFMRTSDPDVYAAGDIVQATELVSGEKRIVGIWKNAALQGACAGKVIAAELAEKPISEHFALKGSISMNTITMRGTLFISAGTIEINEKRHVEVEETADTTIVYLYEETGNGSQLVGFNLVCDTDDEEGVAYEIGAMLTMRVESDAIRAQQRRHG
jgi:NAD(P)H-nitrite reductase large subunit